MRIGALDGGPDDIEIEGDVTQGHHRGWIELDSIDYTPPGSKPDEAAIEKAKAKTKAAKAKSQKASKKKSEDDTSSSAEEAVSTSSFSSVGLRISKMVDCASCELVKWALGGKPRDLKIDCCREEGETFLRLLITGGRITSFESDSDWDDTSETLTILYTTLTLESGFHDEDGQQQARNTAVADAEEAEDAEDQISRAPVVLAPLTTEGITGETAPTGGVTGPGETVATVASAGAAVAGRQATGVTVDVKDTVQDDRILEIADVAGVELQLESFRGRESLSNPFEFTLDVISEELEIKPEDVIGEEAQFWVMDHPDAESDEERPNREFHGLVREIISRRSTEGIRRYTLRVVPWLWFLKKRTNSKIFQDKTVVEILEEVFGDLGYSDFDTSNIHDQYSKLEYCVQYRESDFDFVSRLMEEWGIFYFFAFPEGSHKMMLADSTVAYEDCGQKEVAQSLGSMDEPHIVEWARRATHIAGKSTFRDYNYTTPNDSLEAEAGSVVNLHDKDKFELFDYPGRYPDMSEGRRSAQVRMEREETAHLVVDGTSGCDQFTAGTKFTVKMHDCQEEEGQEYVLAQVVHDAAAFPGGFRARLSYRNAFVCLPRQVKFRPPRKTPRPLVHGPQTARVVGKSGEEIDTDKYGRIKVQFHRDRIGKKDENSSCWVRVAQSLAGKNWGSIWIPRMGQEVVVEFLEGDPDRPLVTGMVYNGELKPPYALPANKTQTGWKIRSTKKGGPKNFNELRFENKKDSEQIYLQAEKDMETLVKNDQTLTVGGDEKGSRKVTVEKDLTTTVNTGDRSTTIEKGNDDLAVKEGDRKTEVQAGKDSLTVNKDCSLTVETGNRDTKIEGGKDTLTVQKDRSLVIQQGDQKTSVKLGSISTDAMKSIELKVGQSSLKVDQSGVTIKGMTVKLEGTLSTQVKGLMCDVKGDVMLKAGGGITMIG